MFTKTCMVAVAVIIGCVYADQTNDFYYRPYPVLLVHGFNTLVGGTWGINVEKTNTKNNRMSTKIKTDGLNPVWEDSGAAGNDFGEMLMKSYPRDGKIYDFVTDNLNGTSPQDYKDYWGDVTSLVESRENYDIREEDDSYKKINHCFVEVYCPYYYNESDDADGVQDAEFRGGSLVGGRPYSIAYDGQTQLVRIRIIQVLNEYYGPWKWVHDPTAKINIVCHSNGGGIVTNALKYDEEYYDEGKPGDPPCPSGECPYPPFWVGEEHNAGFYITGRGFRLRDHINKVITANTPFAGSIMAEKDGSVPPFVKDVLNSVTMVAGAEAFFGTYGPIPQGLASIAGPGGTTALLNMLFTNLAGGAIGGFDTPVMMDLASGSDYNMKLKGNGVAPTYSEEHYLAGQQVPYINYTSNAMHLTSMTIGVSAICTYYGVKNMIASSWWFPLPTPWKAAPWFNMAYQMGRVTKWLTESDAVLQKESQDIRSIYPLSDRKIRTRNDAWHGEQVHKNRTAIRSDLNSPTALTITNAIGENQTSDTSVYTTFEPEHDNSYYGTNYINRTHPIVKFSGFCSPNAADLWPGNANDIITMNATSGRPKTIVGIINAYFINSTDLRVRVNTNAWQQMQFNRDFGNFASRFVDRDNSNTIDQNDLPGGAYIFANVDPAAFEIGENLVTFKLFPGSVFGALVQLTPPTSALEEMHRDDAIQVPGPPLTCNATVLYGNPVRAFESDMNGNISAQPVFFKQPVKWDYLTGETKTVYVTFNRRVSDLPMALNSVSIIRQSGNFILAKVVANPAAGQFAVLPATVSNNNLFKIVLSGDQLDKTGAVANVDSRDISAVRSHTVFVRNSI
jgi:hypothetical protein